MYQHIYVCMYVYTHSHSHHNNNTGKAHILWQHTLFSHSVFMCSPNDFILGLAFTVAMISQTAVKAFASHFFFKHARRSWDCWVLSSFWLIFSRSPSDMIPWCSSSNIMAVAFTFSTNCCRQWWRNSAVWKGKRCEWNTQADHTHVGLCHPTVEVHIYSSII